MVACYADDLLANAAEIAPDGLDIAEAAALVEGGDGVEVAAQQGGDLVASGEIVLSEKRPDGVDHDVAEELSFLFWFF